MISTSKAKEIAREIQSIEVSGNPEAIVVSIDQNGEARWGEAMAMTESDMESALESAGMNSDISDMMTAEDFRSYFADCIK